jgi:fatty-acyl-CoA synthase
MWHADLLGERARLTPGKLALVDKAWGCRLSFRELNERAEATARVLLGDLGLLPGERLALLAGNRLEFLDLYFAASKSGAVLVPLNPRLAVPELATILGHAEPKGLVFAGELAEKALAAAEEVGLSTLIPLDPLPSFPTPTLAQKVAQAPSVPLPRPLGGEAPLAILYTSGTTGAPKGVVIPHRMVAFNAWATAIAWELRSEDVSPIFTPLYHAGGLSAFLTPLIAVGGTIILHRGFDPEEVWRTMEGEGCTVALGVPTLWRLLADHPLFSQVNLSQVRWFISGGAPLPVQLIHRYKERGVVLRQGYGLTEVGVNCFTMTDQEAWEKAGSIGKPFPFTQARVVDKEGKALGPGEVGELLLAGPHVSAGYFRNPQATAEAFDPEGFFHTGDMVTYDPEGFYYVVGRAKEMFISGGVNVFPGEVEAVLQAHPQVLDVAVVGVPDELWGEHGVAFVVAAGDLSADKLVEFLRPRIASFKIPKEFFFVEALPRTAYGKVVRRALVEQWRRRQGAQKP